MSKHNNKESCAEVQKNNSEAIRNKKMACTETAECKEKKDIPQEPPAEQDESIDAKFEKLQAECKNWQEQYLRKAADFDNYRKRMIREKQEAIDYANTNLLLDLVKVLDDFDRAIEAGQSASAENSNGTAAFAEGVLMIKNQLSGMLESKYGLSCYTSKGTVFDPNIHEAVATAQSDTVKEPTVGEELQKGYKLKDRVIRHAKVMVLMPAEVQDNKEQSETAEAKKAE